VEGSTLRRAAQATLFAVAALAAVGAGYRYLEDQQAGLTTGPQVAVEPAAGPVGMRPFIELRGFPVDRDYTVFLCPPGSRGTAGCLEWGKGKPLVRFQAKKLPATLPSGADLAPGEYPLRVGPDAEGRYEQHGVFDVVPFAIGARPKPASFAGVNATQLRLGGATRIATGVDCQPVFAPDGRLVVGSTLLDPSTGVTTELKIKGAELLWSPDRDKLAILVGDSKEIRLAGPDGAEAVAVVREARGFLGSLSWSPAGDRLAFTARNDPSTRLGPGPPSVRAFNPINGSTKVLAPGVAVAWSPKGDTLAIESSPGTIELYDRVSGKRTKVAEGRVPGWSPDGSYVTFLRTQGKPSGEFWAVQPGSAPVRLIDAGVCGATFSPSGRSLAVVTREGNDRVLSIRRVEVR
jgi:hypothetical protein